MKYRAYFHGGLILLFILAIGCKTPMPDEKDFEAFKPRFLTAMAHHFPEWAASNGYFADLHLLQIYTPETQLNQLIFCKLYQDSIQYFLPDLSGEKQAEAERALALLEERQEDLEANRHEWDPSFYDISPLLKNAVSNDLLSNSEKEAYLAHLLDLIPPYLRAAQATIKKPSIHTVRLAIKQQTLAFKYLQEDITAFIQNPALAPAKKEGLLKKQESAAMVIKNYIAYCRSLEFEYDDIDSPIEFRE